MAAIPLNEHRRLTPPQDDGILVFQRELCEPPAWGALSRRLRARLCAVDAGLRAGLPAPLTSRGPAQMFPALDDAHWRGFEHELSWAIPQPITEWPVSWSDRTVGEQAALVGATAQLDRAVRGADSALFKAALMRLGQEGFDAPFAFRGNDWVGTIASSGGGVRFPAPDQAARRVDEIFAYLAQPHPSALFQATVLKVMVTNAHPLSDGNGRTSRILFNYALRRGIAGRGYLPLKEYTMPSRGHVQIAMRLAETRGQWEPMLHLMCDIALDWVSRDI